MDLDQIQQYIANQQMEESRQRAMEQRESTRELAANRRLEDDRMRENTQRAIADRDMRRLVLEQQKLSEQRQARQQREFNPFRDLTMKQKDLIQQQGQAIGLNGPRLMNALRQYGSMGKAAEAMGYPQEISEMIEDYVPPDKDQIKQMKAEVFGDVLNDYFNKYSDKSGAYKNTFTFQGLSPRLEIDKLLGRNKKDQINYLTAQGLARDTATQQVMMSNMRTGHFAVKAIEQALQHVTPGWVSVDSDVRRGVMNNIHKVFKEGLKAQQKAVNPKSMFSSHVMNSLGMDDGRTEDSGMDGVVRFVDNNGRTYSIPASRQDAIAEADRRGWRKI